MKNVLCILRGLPRGGSRITKRAPGFGRRFLPGMLFIILVDFCPSSVLAASLSIYDQVAFANPGFWQANAIYGTPGAPYYRIWQPSNAYDTGMQDYTNYDDGYNPHSTSNGEAASWAAYGSLRSSVTTATSGSGAYSGVYSGAEWQDIWTITGAGLTGVGTLTISYNIAGSLSDPYTSYIRGMLFEMDGFVPFEGYWSQGVNDQWTGDRHDAHSGVFSIPFLFNAPNDITTSLQTRAEYNGWADFTATISGLQVLDSSGNPVHDYVFNSASGYGYGFSSSAVPEPASVLCLLAASFVGLLAIRRKSKK